MKTIYARHVTAPLVGVLIGMVASLSQATTIAYWRFESGGFTTDSSGNGHPLTQVNSSLLAQSSIPGSGPTSAFPNPIPQTSAANAYSAQRLISGDSSTAGYFTAPDDNAFTTNTLTLECFVNFSYRSTALGFVAGHFQGSGNHRSYALVVRGTDAGAGFNANEFGAVLSQDGTSSSNPNLYRTIGSGFTIENDIDYYLAIVVDLSAPSAADRYVRFYLKDLTNNGPLQTSVVSDIGLTSLNNPSIPFSLGAQGDGSARTAWSGYLDEVRLSGVALTQDQLLIIPEPGTVVLLGVSGLLLAIRRRHQCGRGIHGGMS